MTAAFVPLDAQNKLPLIAPVLAFIIYEIVQAAVAAYTRPPPSLSWWRGFVFFSIGFAFSNALIASIVVYLSFRIDHIRGINIILLIAFVGLMSLRNLAAGAWGVIFVPEYLATYYLESRNKSWVNRFLQFGTVKQGLRVLTIIAGGLLFLAFGAWFAEP